MKTRNGFVTNSSSSSFVIIGKRVKDYNEVDLSKARYVALGSYLNEGQDVFEVEWDEM